MFVLLTTNIQPPAVEHFTMTVPLQRQCHQQTSACVCSLPGATLVSNNCLSDFSVLLCFDSIYVSQQTVYLGNLEEYNKFLTFQCLLCPVQRK